MDRDEYNYYHLQYLADPNVGVWDWGGAHTEFLGLDLASRGALVTILSRYWAFKKPVPCDEKYMCSYLRIRPSTWKKIRQEIAEYVIETPKGLIPSQVSWSFLRPLDKAGWAYDLKKVGRESISSAVREMVWQKSQGRCAYCKNRMIREHGFKASFTIDHVLAVSRGGGNEIDNLVGACRNCNIKKNAKDLQRFLQEMGVV